MKIHDVVQTDHSHRLKNSSRMGWGKNDRILGRTRPNIKGKGIKGILVDTWEG